MLTINSLSATHWKQELEYFFSSQPKKPLVVVLGPTASGKTDFSIRLAHFLHSYSPEILNADSRQIYKYLDIGTAKITEVEKEGIPHHLLSVLDPAEPCTIAWYQKEATAIIDFLQKKQHLPILVGGSMLYLSAIIDGLQPVSPVNPVIRAKLQKEYDVDGGVQLLERLRKVDPRSAANIPRENKTYLVRALEIFESTGFAKSLQENQISCPYDLLILGMQIDVEVLKQRIDSRTHTMLTSGWIEEVSALKKQGYGKENPGLQSHGYREILAYLERENQDITLLEQQIAPQVRQYAKRQRTWWRHDARIRWITAD